MNNADKSTLIELLNKINPKQPYGTELFNALARLTVSVAIEAVCLRQNLENQDIEIYLAQRSSDDSAYPNEWHCPGSVMRPGESFEDVLQRLAGREFKANLISAKFVANINPSPLSPEERGHFLSIVYLCVVEEAQNQRGKWFSIDNLPDRIVEGHLKRIIPCALGAFVADYNV